MQNHDTPKQCKKCGGTDFTPGGKCRACQRAYNQRYYTANRDRLIAHQAAYYRYHKSECRQWQQNHYYTHRDEILQQKREYYQRNREAIVKKQAEYRQKSKDKTRIRMRRLYIKNADQIIARARDWRKANPERVRQQRHKGLALRRARKKRVVSEPVCPQAILKRDASRCYLCGEDITGNFHLDHVIPLSQGGPHTADNTRVTHPACNIAKGGRRPEQVTHLFPRLSTNPERWDTPPSDARADATPHTGKPDSYTD